MFAWPCQKILLSLSQLFGKVGQLASEEVTLQLIKSKCIPVLLYGLEACLLKNVKKTVVL